MEKNKNVLISIIALSFILVTFGIAPYTSAGFELNQEQRKVMEEAIKEGNYSKWKNAKEVGIKITDIVTKENFSQFSVIHSLIENKKDKKTDILREGLVLSEEHEFGKFENEDSKREHEYVQGVVNMIKTGHYEEWKKEFRGTKISEVIQTEKDFQRLLDTHNLMKDRKYVEIENIHNALEFKKEWVGKRRVGVSEKWYGKIHLDK